MAMDAERWIGELVEQRLKAQRNRNAESGSQGGRYNRVRRMRTETGGTEGGIARPARP
jgi:hypothetical protein